MKILLIHPPIRVTDDPKHIPYGLSILGALADGMGHDVALLDMNANRLGLEALKADSQLLTWDVIGIGGLSSQYKYIKAALPVIRKAAPDAVIVAGGGFLSSLPREIMQLLPEIDLGAIGEAEQTWTEILQHVSDKNWDRIDGVIYRQGSELRMTPPRSLMSEEELNKLPYPRYDLLPLDIYFKNSPLALSPESLHAQRRIDGIWERGCPYACTFCFHCGMSLSDQQRIYGREACKDLSTKKMVRFQSARYVVDQILYLRKKYCVDFISFLDENLTTNVKRLVEICDLLEKEELVGLVKFGCLGHVRTVSYELLQRMRDVGFCYISYGGESASGKCLKEMHKNQSVAQMQAAIDATKKAQLNPVMTFMMGMPSDTVTSMIETVEFWKKNGILCEPFYETPYPGTELFNQYRGNIIAQHSNGSTPSLDHFLTALGDATELVVNLSSHYNDIELMGLRAAMCAQDVERMRKFSDEKLHKLFPGIDLEPV